MHSNISQGIITVITVTANIQAESRSVVPADRGTATGSGSGGLAALFQVTK